ncbi:integrator complex subunit [Thraustotheca clavata]|uniref:Integrator complex subunit n=1 Tax=Thraustotheca clavata TaxID=74557 RepID=A0A1V9ZA49_9STRA|nr:integrator complex subunit [Thraustotheca clavata]
MLVTFIVDTSASMAQRSACGMSLLDFAKSVVETMAKKLLSRTLNRMNYMHFMLVTFGGVVVGMEHSTNRDMFYKELKYLEPNDLSDVGAAIATAFDLINRERAKIFCDNYGLGRLPFNAHMSHVVLITDAGTLTTLEGIQADLLVPPTSLSSLDLTRQPFRWDQRLFTFAVQLSAESLTSKAPAMNPPYFSSLCEETGGTLHMFTNGRVTKPMLEKEVESIIARMKPGVLVKFACEATEGEEFAATTNTLTPSVTLNREYTWPIPEAFWVDRNTTNLPLRDAHPTLTYRRSVESPTESATNQLVLDTLKFPTDTYLIESTLNPVPPRGSRWMVYMVNSKGDGRLGEPFGYLRTTAASSVSAATHLVILPYNYPVLFSLLVEAARQHQGAAVNPANPWFFNAKVMSASWKDAFSTYVLSCPIYYSLPLRKILKRYNLHDLVPEIPENGRSYQVTNHLTRMKDVAMVESSEKAPSVRSTSHVSPHSTPSNSPFRVTTTKQVNQAANQLNPAQLLSEHSSQRQLLFNTKREYASNEWTGALARLAPSASTLATLDTAKFSLSVEVMSDYIPTVLKNELLRNPFGDPEKDEHTVEGTKRRKLEFSLGSPYKKSSTKKGDDMILQGEAADEAAALGSPSSTNSSRRQRSKQKYKKQWRREMPTSPTSPETSPTTVSANKPGEEALKTSTETALRLGIHGNEHDQDGLFVHHVYHTIVDNSSVWNGIVKLIRSPRFQPRDASGVMKELALIKGEKGVRLGYIALAIELAKAFKRTLLVKMLVKSEQLIQQEV